MVCFLLALTVGNRAVVYRLMSPTNVIVPQFEAEAPRFVEDTECVQPTISAPISTQGRCTNETCVCICVSLRSGTGKFVMSCSTGKSDISPGTYTLQVVFANCPTKVSYSATLSNT